ncbi:hypothetical protein BRX36_10810 [Sphingomonas sp. S-NIH.Pt1_0416]|uniref:hypothetical protein n=1 Tax=Sphingomonas sp. S-NIH.Pt1_0416 TaxID=1920123 RepID=UPI000F7F7796|nr:hypothetical protein [Sphingomonas sp. S-NIH.Pt1_0416]RSU65270.1 hypothetical protein BRX36_10810 [Sphingomonas sp. S-NIH.Pt1_0416]
MIPATVEAPAALFPPMPAIRDAPYWRNVAQRWAGLTMSGAILLTVAVQLGSGGLSALVDATPRHPAFWAVFALLYIAPSAAEWLIFRRLWRLPAVGLVALLRKQIANELILGYSGDAHFYLWARGHLRMANSPFGAVKDVAILSAVSGNAVTLLLMVLSWPLLVEAVAGPLANTFAWSVALIAATSLLLFGFRRQLFSLRRPDLLFVSVVHVARIAVCLGLLALLAHLLLPEVAVQWLLVLVTLRMMLSRLPLLPAKDVVFAGLVAILFGREAQIVPVIALIGSLTVAAHLIVGLLTSVEAFASREKAA